MYIAKIKLLRNCCRRYGFCASCYGNCVVYGFCSAYRTCHSKFFFNWKTINTSLKMINTSLKTINTSLKMINTSLKTINTSLKTINTSLKTINNSLKLVKFHAVVSSLVSSL
jgi:hypothetical protein